MSGTPKGSLKPPRNQLVDPEWDTETAHRPTELFAKSVPPEGGGSKEEAPGAGQGTEGSIFVTADDACAPFPYGTARGLATSLEASDEVVAAVLHLLIAIERAGGHDIVDRIAANREPMRAALRETADATDEEVDAALAAVLQKLATVPYRRAH